MAVAFLAAWSAWFILRTSFPGKDGRVFCLADDAMISMAYARNAWHGLGLNWARFGAPVEGFTHPLWLAVMGVANAVPLPPTRTSLLVQIASAVCLLANLGAVRRLWRRLAGAEPGSSAPLLLLVATYYPLNYWALMGMETGLQALLVTLLACEVIDALNASGNPRRLAILAGLLSLLRMDMLLLLLPAAGALAVKRRRREAIAVASGACVTTAAYELFRWAYFRELLPNTYYLKVAGVPFLVRLLRGLDVFGGFARSHWLLLGLLAIAGLTRKRRSAAAAYLASTAGVAFAYSLYVGGDVWDYSMPEVRANRFVAFVMPLVFALAVLACDRLGSSVWPRHAWESRRTVWNIAAAAILALSVNGLLPLSGPAGEPWRLVLVTARPPQVDSNRVVYARWEEFREIAPAGSTVATFWAGIPAFFGDYRMIDILGFSDLRTARLPPAFRLHEDNYRDFVPGHAKWDNRYLLEVVRPDVFFQTWGIPSDRVDEIMGKHGYRMVRGFWFRNNIRPNQPPR